MACLKKAWPKLQIVLTMVVSIFIEVSNCLEGSTFFAEKLWFLRKNNFYPKTAISAMNLNYILQLVLIYLNKTKNHILNTIHASILAHF